jgi:hypothetical protein
MDCSKRRIARVILRERDAADELSANTRARFAVDKSAEGYGIEFHTWTPDRKSGGLKTPRLPMEER